MLGLIVVVVCALVLKSLIPPSHWMYSSFNDEIIRREIPTKRVLITGASLGIGREIAKEFAAAGIKHVALVARNKSKLLQVRQEILDGSLENTE